MQLVQVDAREQLTEFRAVGSVASLLEGDTNELGLETLTKLRKQGSAHKQRK